MSNSLKRKHSPQTSGIPSADLLSLVSDLDALMEENSCHNNTKNDSIDSAKGNYNGNFKDYYEFNTVQSRMEQLCTVNDLSFNIPSDQDTLLILDVGCNQGDLTVAFSTYLSCNIFPNKHFVILGIDLDSDLIDLANTLHSSTTKCRYCFKQCDITKDDQTEDTIRPLLSEYKRDRFDFVFCFSITMWIHLNGGDNGLQIFLKTLSLHCQYLFIEPQPWACYRRANQRLRREQKPEFMSFYKLKLNTNMELIIKDYLEEHCSLKLKHDFGETKWSRLVLLFELPLIEKK